MKQKYPNKMNLPDDTIEKLWNRIEYPENYITAPKKKDVCLEWCGVFDQYNRPVFRPNGKYVLAKRVMYESVYGPIDDNKVVSNICFNKKCVRPDHLCQNYFFRKETFARNGERNPNDRRKKLRVVVTEKDMLTIFNGVKEGRFQSINDIGIFLNIDDEDVVEFVNNDEWQFINQHYRKEKLDEIRGDIIGL